MKAKMQIERPNGNIEEVIAEVPFGIDWETFKRESTRQTKEAGRGQIMSFEQIVPLKKQRKHLAADIQMWVETAQYQHSKAISQGQRPDTSNADKKAKEAAEALREFDAKHPEIKAEIDREDREKTEKLMQRWI